MKTCLFFLTLLCPFLMFSQKVFSVNYGSQAEVRVFVTDYESQADLKIYFAPYESQAGWRNKSKKHLMY